MKLSFKAKIISKLPGVKSKAISKYLRSLVIERRLV